MAAMRIKTAFNAPRMGESSFKERRSGVPEDPVPSAFQAAAPPASTDYVPGIQRFLDLFVNEVDRAGMPPLAAIALGGHFDVRTHARVCGWRRHRTRCLSAVSARRPARGSRDAGADPQRRGRRVLQPRARRQEPAETVRKAGEKTG